MYEREIIWELFHQVILETWQGGQAELSFSVEHKPWIEMSLAQCSGDQLTPRNQTVLNPADSKGEFPLQRFLLFLGQGLVLLTITHCGTAKPETLPEAAWADGEKIH